MKIEELIEKYFDGNTSPEEEIYLQEYFRNDSIPQNMECYKDMFDYMSKQAHTSIEDPDFENQIISKIVNLENKRKSGRALNYWIISSVAACIIIISSFIFFISGKTINSNKTFTAKTSFITNNNIKNLAEIKTDNNIKPKAVLTHSHRRKISKNNIDLTQNNLVTFKNPLRGLSDALIFVSQRFDMIDKRLDSAMSLNKSLDIIRNSIKTDL